MAAILDLATRYLTYRFFVVFMLILELINLHLDTKTIILGELVHASWLFLEFSDKMAAILDLAWLAALDTWILTWILGCRVRGLLRRRQMSIKTPLSAVASISRCRC